MKKTIFTIIIALTTIIVRAQIPQPDPDTTAKHFLIVASIKNLQEVSAAGQAIQKATNPGVKAFAQMMVKDHGDAEQKLLALASRRHIQLPPAATGDIKPDPLLISVGGNFDKNYIHAMVAGHGNTVQTFENYAVTGKDPAVRAFAQQMLPTLKMHLEHIKSIDVQLK